jgi:hypothetical protein
MENQPSFELVVALSRWFWLLPKSLVPVLKTQPAVSYILISGTTVYNGRVLQGW